MPAKFELIAPCFFGCEATAKFELTRIGAENIRVGDGRLTFAGGPEMIAAANLNLRTVERVMLLLARYRAATFDDLFDGVYDIPWEELLEIEAAANRYIYEDHAIDIQLHRGAELDAIDYRSKKPLEGDVRIVTFPGAGCCACCGTHVMRSGQVGIVKFLSVQKFREGVRIELLCGGRAYRYLSACWAQDVAAAQAVMTKHLSRVNVDEATIRAACPEYIKN